MKILTVDKIKNILKEHRVWLEEGAPGVRANFIDVDLTEFNFDRAVLIGADFRGANLTRASMHSTLLQEANLEGANLAEADLRCANLENANLKGANLTDADLRCANLENANLTYASFIGAKVDSKYLSVYKFHLFGAKIFDSNCNYQEILKPKRFCNVTIED